MGLAFPISGKSIHFFSYISFDDTNLLLFQGEKPQLKHATPPFHCKTLSFRDFKAWPWRIAWLARYWNTKWRGTERGTKREALSAAPFTSCPGSSQTARGWQGREMVICRGKSSSVHIKSTFSLINLGCTQNLQDNLLLASTCQTSHSSG